MAKFHAVDAKVFVVEQGKENAGSRFIDCRLRNVDNILAPSVRHMIFFDNEDTEALFCSFVTPDGKIRDQNGEEWPFYGRFVVIQTPDEPYYKRQFRDIKSTRRGHQYKKGDFLLDANDKPRLFWKTEVFEERQYDSMEDVWSHVQGRSAEMVYERMKQDLFIPAEKRMDEETGEVRFCLPEKYEADYQKQLAEMRSGQRKFTPTFTPTGTNTNQDQGQNLPPTQDQLDNILNEPIVNNGQNQGQGNQNQQQPNQNAGNQNQGNNGQGQNNGQNNMNQG